MILFKQDKKYNADQSILNEDAMWWTGCYLYNW